EEVALIKANTPRGNFMKDKHTRMNYQRHWQPEVFSHDTYETWEEKGETIEQICRQKAQDILATHQPERVPAQVEAELERVLRRFLGSDFGFEG
ncbi:MAG: trimethylamine methyltransferase family protein, partial [Anaerolineales bacterium]|nr:trimethylamine methyltransferase family protein [Anaerolineales bacterium]